MKFWNRLIYVKQMQQKSNRKFIAKTCLDRVEFVDSWSKIGWIPTEGDF